MMKNAHGFEFVLHVPDVRIKVWGKTIEELFRSALCGLASYVKPGVFELTKKGKERLEEIKIEAVDINSLLVEFLSKVITESDIYNVVFTDVIFKKLGENFLEGEISGTSVSAFDKEIKAVSYYDVDVRKNSETGLYETTLVFDV